MGGLFGSASVPALPAAVPPPPQVNQPAESAAQTAAEDAARQKGGASSTVQTSAQGVQKRATIGTPSLIGD